MIKRPIEIITCSEDCDKASVSELFKNVQMQGAQEAGPRGVYYNTLSGTVCSATRQMNVFQQFGFTLVEILIAIFILGLVMATVYVSYSGILKVSREMEEENNIYKMARISMNRMIRDLSSLQANAGSFDFRAERRTLNKKEFYYLSFWSASHLAFSENEEEGRPATISYYVQEDEDGENYSLWRSDVATAKPDKEETQRGEFIICRKIDSWKLRFYDSTGRELESWDSSSLTEQKGKAPASVKIELVMVNLNDEEKPYKFMTKVFLPLNK